MSPLVDFTILIPARLESSRLPRKVLADILGLPMIIRVVNQAKKTMARQIIIATDSDEIAQVGQKFNVSVVMTSSYNQNGTDRVAEAVQKIGLKDEEIIINLQSDEPLINPDLINQLATRLTNCTAPVATLAKSIDIPEEYVNPNIVKVVLTKDEEAMYFSRSLIPYIHNHNLPSHILKHMGLYAYRSKFLKIYRGLEHSLIEQVESLEQLRILWHGYAISVLTTTHEVSIGVDTPKDLNNVIKFIKNNGELP